MAVKPTAFRDAVLPPAHTEQGIHSVDEKVSLGLGLGKYSPEQLRV